MRERRKPILRRNLSSDPDHPKAQAAMRDQLQSWLGRWWDYVGGQQCRDINPKLEPYSFSPGHGIRPSNSGKNCPSIGKGKAPG